MYLRRIRLLDWKLYGGEHEFLFPAPGKRKNVVLIGARNGYGKTSLLEAIALGLYGRDGLDIVARVDGSGDDEKRRQSYRRFIEGAWYERARAEGRTQMAVELSFEDDSDGSTVSIRRTWSFAVDGRLIGDGESIAVEVDGQLKLPGKFEDKDDFHRGWVARAALPSHLAQFFLFDGERVQNLARRDMAAQVRMGIEGFLGVKLLRDLETDLGTYVGMKRAEVRGANSELLQKLAKDLDEIEDRLVANREKQRQLNEHVAAAERESEEISGKLAGMGGGAVTTVRRLTEDRGRVEKTLSALKDSLSALLTGDFGLALSGPSLRLQLADRLKAEQRLTKWQTGLDSSAGQVERFFAALQSTEPAFTPPLTVEQLNALEKKVQTAWQSIWHPPPSGCAPSHRHGYLSELDKARVLEHLDRVGQLGEKSIADLLHQINESQLQYDRLTAQINEFSSIEGVLEELTKRLNDVVSRRAAGESEVRALEREQKGGEAERSRLRAEFEREQKAFAEAQPVLQKAIAAEAVAQMLGPFIEDAVGECVDDIAAKMTEAFRAMAHKTHIDRITIDRDCNVRLLAKNGEDVRTLDQSAGENQVFAFALISAIAQAADVRFPLIIDTPLARLDGVHRTNILRHFTDRAGEQIILLSQDTEVVNEFKDVIGTKVAETYLIENEARPGGKAGRARVSRSRYF